MAFKLYNLENGSPPYVTKMSITGFVNK